MCLALPGKIEKIKEHNKATVDFGKVKRTVNLDLLPNPKIGDHVLVHAGYAINTVSKEEADFALRSLKELYGINN